MEHDAAAATGEGRTVTRHLLLRAIYAGLLIALGLTIGLAMRWPHEREAERLRAAKGAALMVSAVQAHQAASLCLLRDVALYTPMEEER